jgi:hypothetical protein
MDPIQPIEPHIPWVAEPARPERTPGVSRERDRAGREGRRRPEPRREPPRARHTPDGEEAEGGHIDVRA